MLATFESLVGRLVRKGAEAAGSSSAPNSDPTPTSIRLKPQTKHFIEHQAKALGTSAQSVINMILDGVAESSVDRTAGALRTIRERFFFLFQAHELDLPATISVMKGLGFRLSDLDNPARLLDLLDQAAIRHIALTFCVRPEWVSGVTDYPVSNRGFETRWYKNVHSVARRLVSFHQQQLQPHVMFIRREHAQFDVARRDDTEALREPVGVVVRLTRVTDDGVAFAAYEVWGFERWNYWRCRQQFKLLVAFCDQARGIVSYAGYQLPKERLEALSAGELLPAVVFDRLGGVSWYPDDYACFRDRVTKEVDEWPSVAEEYQKADYDAIVDAAASRPAEVVRGSGA